MAENIPVYDNRYDEIPKLSQTNPGYINNQDSLKSHISSPPPKKSIDYIFHWLYRLCNKVADDSMKG